MIRAMTHFYYNPTFLSHETGQHPESPQRLKTVIQQLQEHGMLSQCVQKSCPPLESPDVHTVHTPEHWQQIESLAEQGGGMVDADTIVSTASPAAALAAAGAAVDAVNEVVAENTSRAFCLIRPPGHHAVKQHAMGFCLLNNIAIAAKHAVEQLGLDRVLIVDWDVHHGNGTQDIFYEESRVGFFSMHRHPFYPGTGLADETGRNDGLGTTLNLPAKFGLSRDRYLSWFARELGDFADRMKPQLILLSAGFDSHRADPVGSLGLEVEDFASLTATAMDIAATHAGGRLVSLLEGGYNPPVLADCVEAHLAEMLERDRDEAADIAARS